MSFFGPHESSGSSEPCSPLDGNDCQSMEFRKYQRMHNATLVPKVSFWQHQSQRRTAWQPRTNSDNDHLKATVGANLHKTMRDIPNELNADRCTDIRNLKQIGKVKKMDKWVPRELTENPKNCRFEVFVVPSFAPIELRNSITHQIAAPFAYSLPLLRASRQLLAEKHFRKQDHAETAFDVFLVSRTTQFFDIGIKKLVSCWQE